MIPEFDVPGHTESWEPGNPGILTPCYHNGSPNGEFGPMDPTKKSVFDFLHKFFKEVTTVFPDKYLHIGGDEVRLDCWKSNPSTSSYVQKHHKGNFRALESEFINKLLDIIKSYPTNNGYIGKFSNWKALHFLRVFLKHVLTTKTDRVPHTYFISLFLKSLLFRRRRKQN